MAGVDVAEVAGLGVEDAVDHRGHVLGPGVEEQAVDLVHDLRRRLGPRRRRPARRCGAGP